jgi:hypothetical protein
VVNCVHVDGVITAIHVAWQVQVSFWAAYGCNELVTFVMILLFGAEMKEESMRIDFILSQWLWHISNNRSVLMQYQSELDFNSNFINVDGVSDHFCCKDRFRKFIAVDEEIDSFAI